MSVGSQVRAGQPLHWWAAVAVRVGLHSISKFAPGSGGQSTAVVGKISFVSICRNVLAFAALLALSSPVIAGSLPSSLMILGIARTTKTRCCDAFRYIRRCITRFTARQRDATKAHNSGHEVLIHLPMAPLVNSRWRKIRYARR